MVDLESVGVRSYISELDRGRRTWKANPRRAMPFTGIDDAFAAREENGSCANATSGSNARVPICMKPGGCGVSCGHDNIRKRLLVHARALNLGLLMRALFGVGTSTRAPGPRGGATRHVVVALVVSRNDH